MLKSIIVYSILMGTMVLFAVFISKNEHYKSSSGIIVQKSFWRFETLFPLLFFALMFGMRYDVGSDHIAYLEGYLRSEHVGKNDILFELLTEISWKLNLHYTVYFGIIAFIQVFYFFYAFKDEKYLYPYLVFFLFTNGEWSFWMNGMRQALAMCIWIFSIKYIEEKKISKYFIWVIVASLFHKSAIILILFYPILRNGKDYFKSVPLQLLFIAAAFVFKVLFSELILRFEPIINSYAILLGGDLYSGYNMERLIESVSEREGTGLAYLFKILLNIFIIIYSRKIKLFYNSKRFNIIYFFFFIGLITLYMFPTHAISFTRPFQYFYIFQSIMYAYFIFYLYKTKIKNTPHGIIHALIYYGLIIIFLGIFYLFQITSTEEAHLWYQFFFEHNIKGYPI